MCKSAAAASFLQRHFEAFACNDHSAADGAAKHDTFAVWTLFQSALQARVQLGCARARPTDIARAEAPSIEAGVRASASKLRLRSKALLGWAYKYLGSLGRRALVLHAMSYIVMIYF